MGIVHSAVTAAACQPPGSANVFPAMNIPPSRPTTAIAVNATYRRDCPTRLIVGHLFSTSTMTRKAPCGQGRMEVIGLRR